MVVEVPSPRWIELSSQEEEGMVVVVQIGVVSIDRLCSTSSKCDEKWWIKAVPSAAVEVAPVDFFLGGKIEKTREAA